MKKFSEFLLENKMDDLLRHAIDQTLYKNGIEAPKKYNIHVLSISDPQKLPSSKNPFMIKERDGVIIKGEFYVVDNKPPYHSTGDKFPFTATIIDEFKGGLFVKSGTHKYIEMEIDAENTIIKHAVKI